MDRFSQGRRVYRLGRCFLHLDRPDSADNCFRRYVDLLLAGIQGTYSLDDAASQIHRLGRNGKQRPLLTIQHAIAATLRDSEVKAARGDQRRRSQLNVEELIAS